MKSRFYHYLRNRKIYYRVHRFNLMIAITSLILITIVSISIYTNISMIHLSENEAQSLYYFSKNIENELYQTDNEITQIVQSATNQNLLKDYLVMSDLEKYLSIRLITQEVSSQLSMSDCVTEVFFFTNNYVPINVFNGLQRDFNIEEYDYITFLKETTIQNNKTVIADATDFLISPATSDSLMYAKRIPDLGNDSINVGYILIYINKEALFNFNNSHNTQMYKHAQNHIVGQTGSVLYSSQLDITGKSLPDLLSTIKKEEAQGNNDFYAGKKYPYSRFSMCAFSYIDVLSSYVITTIPYSFFASELLYIAGILLLLMLLLSIVSTLISKHITKSITDPITGLLNSLEAISASDFSLADYDSHNDELANLRNLLNDTTRRISSLIEQIRQAEQQKYALQFKALHAQINPHFLINTLNTVIWLSELQGAENIQQLTSSLIVILDNNLKNDCKVITIKEELALLNKYITIQKFRYFDRFSLTLDIQEEILSHKMLKFVLQPLVENCLKHGLSDAALININVKIYREDDRLHLIVCDNGVGMTAQKIYEVLKENANSVQKTSPTSHIGISNINSRVKLFYGPNYSLDIQSKVGKGTQVKLAFPFHFTEDTND